MSEKKAIIVGAGPAGLTCATYLTRAGWKVDVFSGEEHSLSCLAEAPIVMNYPGFPNGINGLELLNLFVEQATLSGATIHSESVIVIDTNDKVAVDENNTIFNYDEVVVATGVKPRKFECKGIDKIPVHTCAICDGNLYKGCNVVVIGGGDTAISSALYLSNIASKVSVLVRKAHCRCTNKLALDALAKKDNVGIMYETTLESVTLNGDGKPILHLGKKDNYADVMLINVSAIFSCIGHDENKVPVLGNGKVWKCGDCVEEHRQVAIAVGSGAKAALEIIKS